MIGAQLTDPQSQTTVCNSVSLWFPSSGKCVVHGKLFQVTILLNAYCIPLFSNDGMIRLSEVRFKIFGLISSLSLSLCSVRTIIVSKQNLSAVATYYILLYFLLHWLPVISYSTGKSAPTEKVRLLHAPVCCFVQ